MEVLNLLAVEAGKHLHVIEAESHPNLHDLRGLHYAGWSLKALYTHCWEFADPDDVFAAMNRERRRLIRRAGETYTFGPMETENTGAEFIKLYRQLVAKFDWAPLERWDQDLQARIRWLQSKKVGCVYGAKDHTGDLRAAVILLLSRDDNTVYLWRCGYVPDNNANTVIPGLYWHACQHIREQWNEPFTANFGGSPRLTLSHFKDYLGAKPVLHFKLVYEQPGMKTTIWRCLRRGKETLRRALTRCGVLGKRAAAF
jgi:hypothetical protein